MLGNSTVMLEVVLRKDMVDLLSCLQTWLMKLSWMRLLWLKIL